MMATATAMATELRLKAAAEVDDEAVVWNKGEDAAMAMATAMATELRLKAAAEVVDDGDGGGDGGDGDGAEVEGCG